MPAPTPYSYAVVRIVPRVDRDEFVNAGVIVFSRQRNFLEARTHLDRDRLRALWPSLDVEEVERHLEAIRRVSAGEPAAGPLARMSRSERFHWLTSPRSTMIQVSPVRTGLSDEPERLPPILLREMVETQAASS